MSQLTDYTVNDAPMVMDIRSDTLEPISGVQGVSNRFVFRLDQAGYLDANSMLLFKVVSNNAVGGNNNMRVNMVNGGLGAIKRCTFQVGDFIINDVDGANMISHLMNMTTQPESVKNQLNGWYYQNCLHTRVLPGASAVDLGAAVQGTGTITVDKVLSGMTQGAVNNNNNAAAINSCQISNAQANNQQIGIPLGVLFPALKGRTIPLFLFQDYRILLTFEFHDGAEFCNDIRSVNGTAANAATGANSGLQALLNSVNYQDVKLQVDYVIMPSAIQNRDREMTNQEGGLRLDFFDSIRVEKQIPVAAANLQQEVEHRIGADNKEVHKVYMVKQFTDTTLATGRNKVESTFVYLNQRTDGVNEEEYNVNIDGINVFQDFKFSPASQYDEASNCLGKDLKVPRPTYFCDDNTIQFQGHDKTGLFGQYKPLCLDLSNGSGQILGGGRNIGAYPIIWKYRRTPSAAVGGADGNGIALINRPYTGAMSVNYYLLVSKTATIRSTPMGTNVVVSY